MGSRSWFAMLWLGLLYAPANADNSATRPFIDGRWHGDAATHTDSSRFKECWASTAFADGTVLTLAENRNASWTLRFSNPAWQLVDSGNASMMVQVDFYPNLNVSTRTDGTTLLEIEITGDDPLLDFVENGHSIKLNSNGFNKVYDLEGSAKVIERIRKCVSEQLADER